MSEFQFVKVDEETLIEFLRNAKYRILIAKAGYKCSEVETLIDQVKKKGIECKVFLDPDENAIRWGFGQELALRELQKNAGLINLQTADRIRMSIVIVDDRALIYMPVALAWESEPTDLVFPNGFIGGSEFVDALLEQIDVSESIPSTIDKVIPFPGCTIPKKDSTETTKEILATIEKLEKNPPVDPTRLRKITVYRNNYKLLKYQMKGVKLKNKSISLKPFNNLFPDLNIRLKASWKAFTKEDMESIREISIFIKEVHSILDQFALEVGRFGHLIKTENKNQFEKKIEEEKKEFLNALTLKPGEKPNNQNSKYIIQSDNESSGQNDEKRKKNLGELIEQGRVALKIYMRNVLASHEEAIESLLKNEKTLFSMVKQKKVNIEDVIDEVLDNFIKNKLKFPKAEDLIERMDVTFDYYDVSNELLHDNVDFKKALEEIKKPSNPTVDLKLREFFDAFKQGA
jgi:hypothetical protein